MKDYYGLGNFFDDHKDDVSDALWSYMIEFRQVCKTDMRARTMRNFIHETIIWISELAYFVNYENDVSEKTKYDMISDFVDEFYDYAMGRFRDDSRGSLSD